MDCITSEIVEEVIESAYLAVNQLSDAEIQAIESFSKIIENAHNATGASSDATTASEIVNSCYCANEVDEIVTQILELACSSCTDLDGQNSIIDEEQVTVNRSAKRNDVLERDGKINKNEFEIESIPDLNSESDALLIVQCINNIDDEEALKIDFVTEHLNCESHESDDSIVVDSIEICKNEEEMPSIEIIPDEPLGSVVNEEHEADFIEQKAVTNDGQVDEKLEANFNEQKVIVDEEKINERREADLDEQKAIFDVGQVDEKREADLNEEKAIVDVVKINGERETDLNEQKTIIDEGQVDEKRESNEVQANEKPEANLNEQKTIIDEGQANEKREANLNEQKAIVDEVKINGERETDLNEQKAIADEVQANEKPEANLNEQKTIIDEEQANEKPEANLNEQKTSIDEGQANEKPEANLNEEKTIIDEGQVNEKREAHLNEQKAIDDEEQANEKLVADFIGEKAIVDEVKINGEREINEEQANKNEERETVLDGQKAVTNDGQVNETREADLNEQKVIIDEEQAVTNDRQVDEKLKTNLNEEKKIIDDGKADGKCEAHLNGQKAVTSESPPKSTNSVRNEFYSDDELHSRGYLMKFIGDVKLVSNLFLPPKPVGISKVLCRFPPEVTQNELIPILEKYGRIFELRFIASGVVIVTYMSEHESANAIKMLNGRIVRESALKVEKLIEKKQLHVAPIPIDARKPQLMAHFDKLTKGLAQVYLLFQPEHPTKNRGYCYLTYRDYECASEAKEIIAGSNYDGRKLSCDYTADAADRAPLFKIFMNHLRPGLTSTDLRKLFSAFGDVIEVDKNNNWASVKFRHPADTQRALHNVDKKLLGNDANISLSKLREN